MRTRFWIAVLAALLLLAVLLGGVFWHHFSVSTCNSTSHLTSQHASLVSPNATPASPSSLPLPSISQALPTSQSKVRPDDLTAGLPVVSAQDSPDPQSPGLIRRVRLVKANFKYPLWRVEETVRRSSPGTPETVVSRSIMIADHAVVRLKPGTEAGKLKSLTDGLGLTIRKTMGMPDCFLVSTPDTTLDALPRLLAVLEKSPDLVHFAEPDYIVHAQQTIPNDPMLSSLWGLRNIARPGIDISASKVWDLSTGDTQVVVAVIDTGIEYTHPDLASNIWNNTAEALNGIDDDGNGFIDDTRGWNFVAGNSNPMDDQGHGTHTAGTIGAVGNNALGIVGVNWHCAILPLKFLDSSGNGTDSDAADAMHYVAELRRRGVNIRVTNNSWGGADYATILRDAVREQASLDILCVAAAGNDGLNNDVYPFYPASLGESNIIAVAATDSNDALATFSNYGLNTVHLAAPGVSILSTVLNQGYGYKNGTSMAAPHVAGAATLLWNTWPSASAAAIRDAILRGTDPASSVTTKTLTGGRLNAALALKTLFRITHTPLENTYNTGADYGVEADVGPALYRGTNDVWLYWNVDGSTNYIAAPLVNISNTMFRTTIPLQPEGTTVYYWLRVAGSTNGMAATAPTNAPAALYSFRIVPPLTLAICGAPDPISSVTPAYGTQTWPSGMVFKASAPASTPPSNGMRWACAGWTGTGSVPETGGSNLFTFTLRTNSTLCWQWRHDIALTHTSAVAYTLNKTVWWPEGHLATTLTAAASAFSGTTNTMFIGWDVDGVRQPDALLPAVNPAPNILMDRPRTANARYVREAQDADADGLKDWWEFYYFGNTNHDANSDVDGDGFNNGLEFGDQTNPQDPASRPEPPAITHTAIPDPVPRPAPFLIEAAITDNYKVVSATLYWNRNGGPTQSNTMSLSSGTLFTNTIPGPGTNSDTFTYWIMARDTQSSTTHGPHTFSPSYPVSGFSPARFDTLIGPETVTNLTLCVTNTGTSALLAELHLLWGGLSHDFESGAGGWSHSGAVDLWSLSTNRSFSGTTAWYCGTPTSRVYGSSMHARLNTPPFYVTNGAELSFRHWIRCELDGQFWRPGWLPNSCWDGGIVEISTNGGSSFSQIAPRGGYPNLISGYSASPWPDRTPCFAGTGTWTQAVFDLSAFTGRVAILRFHFGSDENTEEEGWYIDDVVVSPMVSPQTWATLTSSTNTLPPHSTTSDSGVILDSAGIPTGDRYAALWVTSNDPLNPNTSIPLHLQVRSPARLEWLDAAQTSTNGTGLVTFSNLIHDADGETCNVEMEWAPGSDLPWSNIWLNAVQASVGTAVLSNGWVPSISNIATRSGGIPVTNLLVSVWNTQYPGMELAYSETTRLRGRTWDGLYWSGWVTSQPFRVDNEPPPPPTNLVSLLHPTNTWSLTPGMHLTWSSVAEPRGSGVADFSYGVTTNTTLLVPQGVTTHQDAFPPPLPDGSNFWAWVRSRDAMGNIGLPVFFGPCWIDANPPTPENAALTLSVSPFGNYLVGTHSITGSWTGFTDAGSGITGYYYSSNNVGGTTQGVWTSTLQGVLSALSEDQDHTFCVWARDQVGWIGPAAVASFAVLSPGGDWDHDGMSNLQEETAGTDAADPESQFRVTISTHRNTNRQEFVLQWPGISNRHYIVYSRDSLTAGSGWQILRGGTNFWTPDGIMTCTDKVSKLHTKFYRVTVSAP